MGEAEAFSLHFPRPLFSLIFQFSLVLKGKGKKGDSEVIWGLNQQQTKMGLVGKGLGCGLIVRQFFAQTSKSRAQGLVAPYTVYWVRGQHRLGQLLM